MGVHGLTTYLRENKRTLAKTLKVAATDEQSAIPIVVDAWSLIYALHQRCALPWIYGGEYQEFSKLVTDVVSAWIKVGFKVSFVFDGPYPEIKFPTLLSRASKSIIDPSLLFFRTSAASRTSPHFLKETRIIPPAYFAATLHALDSLRESTSSLEYHFADEECDPYAVELAARLNGYVVGTDSDFVILNADGYLGYIPLDEMVWTALVPDDEPEPVDDDGFQQVTNGKGRSRAVKATSTFGRGIIPPENLTDLTMSCSVFNPTALADHLGLPVTLLPLLASLAGNDFTNQEVTSRVNHHALFFERGLSPVQRIDRVSSTIQSILAPTARRRAKHQVGSVMDLIDRTVNALMAKILHTIGPGQIELITDKIAEGALQYAIPRYEGEHEGEKSLWPTRICALHEPEICPALPSFSRLLEAVADEDDDDEGSDELIMRIQIRTRYLDAYRRGHFPPLLMNCLTSGTYFTRLFIENPDLETVARLARPIRQWCYAILDEALGLPEPIEEEDASLIPSHDGSDEDELVDVIDSDSDDSEMDVDDRDLLAPLKGALKSLRNPDEHSAHLHAPPLPSRTRVITEYLRRGTRLADEAVEVPRISELLPLISDSHYDFTQSTMPLVVQPEEVRLTVMLRALDSDVSGIRDLSPQQVTAVLVLRWILKTTHDRAEESNNSKAREAERWTAREARCFIASFAWSGEALPSEVNAPIVDRHIQLAAQVLHGLEAVTHLSQALLLYPVVDSPVHMFSGRAFHSYLTGACACPDIPEHIWSVCQRGMERAFAGERKQKKTKKQKSQPVASGGKQTAGGLFGMLADTGI
ncbi:PIN domain-like protein [Hymenopellis radicata]|nr:PIN domain-like protein [Hymenopellis radicata]